MFFWAGAHSVRAYAPVLTFADVVNQTDTGPTLTLPLDSCGIWTYVFTSVNFPTDTFAQGTMSERFIAQQLSGSTVYKVLKRNI